MISRHSVRMAIARLTKATAWFDLLKGPKGAAGGECSACLNPPSCLIPSRCNGRGFYSPDLPCLFALVPMVTD